MLGDMPENPEKSVGGPEFIRFKPFPGKQAGVHEILERYS